MGRRLPACDPAPFLVRARPCRPAGACSGYRREPPPCTCRARMQRAATARFVRATARRRGFRARGQARGRGVMLRLRRGAADGRARGPRLGGCGGVCAEGQAPTAGPAAVQSVPEPESRSARAGGRGPWHRRRFHVRCRWQAAGHAGGAARKTQVSPMGGDPRDVGLHGRRAAGSLAGAPPAPFRGPHLPQRGCGSGARNWNPCSLSWAPRVPYTLPPHSSPPPPKTQNKNKKSLLLFR